MFKHQYFVREHSHLEVGRGGGYNDTHFVFVLSPFFHECSLNGQQIYLLCLDKSFDIFFKKENLSALPATKMDKTILLIIFLRILLVPFYFRILSI